MGQHADDIALFADLIDSNTWTTKDGRCLTPQEMTTTHLINAINYAIKQGYGKYPIVDYMQEELDKRRSND